MDYQSAISFNFLDAFLFEIMKKLYPLKTNLLSLLLFLSIPALVATASEMEEKAIYLVMMEGEPVAFRQAATPSKRHKPLQYKREQAKLLAKSHDQLLESNLDVESYQKVYSFHHIINGFAVHTTPTQAKRLESIPGVLTIEKDRRAKLMTTYTPQFLGIPQRVWPQAMAGAKYGGEGMLIGVVDTGIDPNHPSFACSEPLPQNSTSDSCSTSISGSLSCQSGPLFPPGSCNGKIVSARFFARAAATTLPLNSSRDFSPFDELGHGSHVASIAAGNWGVPAVVNGFMYGFASGMAPRARLAVYKALYPAGGNVADIVSAIDQAARDQVDVLVLSVGPDGPPEGIVSFMSILDIALLFARRAGIFVAQAAGNQGPAAATVSSFSPWAMGVAASTTGRVYAPTLLTGDAHRLQGVGLTAPSPGNGLFQFKLIAAKDAAIKNILDSEECQFADALQPELVINSVVICSFSQGFLNGTSSLAAILDTAKALHFIGFIFIANPAYGDFVAHPLPFSVPGIMIPRVADAQVLMAYYENNTCRNERGAAISYRATGAITEGRHAFFSDDAPVVSRFSSRGPGVMDGQKNPADVLKPDILAPGEQIWAAWSPLVVSEPVLSGDDFALLSGTSMAAPHVAGVAALIKQLRPSWNPSMLASALSTTALQHDRRGLPLQSQGSDLHSSRPSTPFDHGAGMVNPEAALDPGLVFSAEFEDYVNFLCALPDVSPALVRSATGMKCDAESSSSPADLNLPSVTISTLKGHQTVKRSVRNVAGKAETYLIAVKPPHPEVVEVSVHPEWFEIPVDGVQELAIEFKVLQTSESFAFGEIVLTGSLNHVVRLPLAIRPVGFG
ncbi:subtilisin-like protease SBT2.4 [Curcuma longa]|uniref:subtilisin-like protease SBT2.4 n=1 Tax=Curcuma longa TaxID=136217 RepID=UPI003D9E1D16